MAMMGRKAIQSALLRYGISGDIVGIATLQESKDPNKTRLIYRINLRSGLKLVCRISDEGNNSDLLVEQQSRFSEKLRAYGIPAARKYSVSGKYCTRFSCGTTDCRFTLEEYAGTDVKRLDLETFRFLGRLLGKMHHISETDPSEIAYSSVRNAIMNGRARFDNVLKHADPAVGARRMVHTIREIHDGLVLQLREILDRLPGGAVHGDLSVFNNLVTMDGRISVIDFDLSGDEPFLCDLLGSIYSSLHKYQWRERMDRINRRDACSQMIASYCSQRNLHDVEIEYFPVAAALFDGLYYCKSLIEEYNLTKNEEVLDRFGVALSYFDLSRHKFETIG